MVCAALAFSVDNFVSNYPNIHILLKHVLICNTLITI